MSFQNGSVTLVGFVATEPKLGEHSGAPYAYMRIGSTTRWKDRETGQWTDGETNFYSVSCWRTLASNAALCLRKGQPVVVAGKLRVSHWQDQNGQQRSEVKLDAETIGYDLSRGIAQFGRFNRAPDAGVNIGEAIRGGEADQPAGDQDGPGPGDAGSAGAMFDELAIAELDQELDASAAEPATK